MRQVKLHKSIVKPKLIMGCERAPFMVIFIVSLLLLVEGSFSVKIAGGVFFAFFTGLIAFLNRKDPFFFVILRRFISQQPFYSASGDYPSRPANPNNKD